MILLNFGWMVDLAMSIFEFLTKFLIFWHPWHPWVCIRSICWKWNLKQIEEIPPSVEVAFKHHILYIFSGFFYNSKKLRIFFNINKYYSSLFKLQTYQITEWYTKDISIINWSQLPQEFYPQFYQNSNRNSAQCPRLWRITMIYKHIEGIWKLVNSEQTFLIQTKPKLLWTTSEPTKIGHIFRK